MPKMRYEEGDRVRLTDPDEGWTKDKYYGTVSGVYPDGEYWVDWDDGTDCDAYDIGLELIPEGEDI